MPNRAPLELEVYQMSVGIRFFGNKYEKTYREASSDAILRTTNHLVYLVT